MIEEFKETQTNGEEYGLHYNGRGCFYLQDTWRSWNLYWSKCGREEQNYFRAYVLGHHSEQPLRNRFTINIKKELDREDSFIAQMSLPEV